jgi:hypothetical protein
VFAADEMCFVGVGMNQSVEEITDSDYECKQIKIGALQFEIGPKDVSRGEITQIIISPYLYNLVEPRFLVLENKEYSDRICSD